MLDHFFFHQKMHSLEERRNKKPEEDTAHACEDTNLACDLKAVEEHSLRLAG
jgi:hypothetical protein